jgi:adenylate kinase
MVYKILMMGPQGSGKGTQAELLSARMGIPAFGMGQLLREEIAAKTDIGRRAEAIILAGNLVSDEVAAEVLQSRLKRPDVTNGYILDGYPRNMAQANAFTFDAPTHLLLIEITDEEAQKRLAGRLTCLSCNKVVAAAQGFKAGDACPCGGTYTVRKDDTPEAIARRLEIYHNDTKPVIETYAARGILHRIDGLGMVEEIALRIAQALGL